MGLLVNIGIIVLTIRRGYETKPIVRDWGGAPPQCSASPCLGREHVLAIRSLCAVTGPAIERGPDQRFHAHAIGTLPRASGVLLGSIRCSSSCLAINFSAPSRFRLSAGRSSRNSGIACSRNSRLCSSPTVARTYNASVRTGLWSRRMG